MQYDVIIVGASFAGLALAHHLPRSLRVLILDRKRALDAAVESTGLITIATKKLFAEFTDVEKFIPNDITTIGVVSPDYEKYFFSHTEQPWIHSTDTPKLLEHIAKTLPENVELKLSALVQGYSIDETAEFSVSLRYKFSGEEQIASGKFLVGADGSHSIVAKESLELSKNKHFLGAMEKVFFGDITFGPAPQNSVYHFWFGEFSLGYGGWLSPTVIDGKNAFRLGLAKLQKDISSLRRLDDFIRILQEKKIIQMAPDAQSLVTFGSLIPIGGALKKVFTNYSLLIGDAAGLCGAFAADGIKGALVSAKVAASLIPRHLKGERNVLRKFYPTIERDYGKLMTYYHKQLLYRFVWDRMKSDRSFMAMYDLIARSQDEFLAQFCDSKEKGKGLLRVVLKMKNIPLLCKYAWYLWCDLFKRSSRER